MFSIFEILPEPAPQIRIVDVGAQWDPAAGEAYTALLKDGRATVLGFEPDVSECNRLNARGGGAHTYLPCVVGDGSRRTFYVCNDARTSSFTNRTRPCWRDSTIWKFCAAWPAGGRSKPSGSTIRSRLAIPIT